MKKLVYWLIAFVVPDTLLATQYQPWFGIDKLLEFRPSYTYRHYDRVNEGEFSVRHTSNDSFVDLSMSISPFPEWSVETELFLTGDNQRSFSIDNIKETVRYLLLDDVTAVDPVSLSVGLSLSHVNHQALRDISSFHHGRTEGELHVAVGKEISCEADWVSHTWGLLGVGLGDGGQGWLHAHAEYDYRFCNGMEVGVFSTLLLGFGDKRLDIDYFNSYGPIKHRSVGVGAFVRYCNFTLQYEGYAYAHNFPEAVQAVTLTYYFPLRL
jgi:hypothetical protein